MTITYQLVQHLVHVGRPLTSRDVAEALGMPLKQTCRGLSSLSKRGYCCAVTRPGRGGRTEYVASAAQLARLRPNASLGRPETWTPAPVDETGLDAPVVSARRPVQIERPGPAVPLYQRVIDGRTVDVVWNGSWR